MKKLTLFVTLSVTLMMLSGCCCWRRGPACPTCGPSPVYSTPAIPGPPDGEVIYQN